MIQSDDRFAEAIVVGDIFLDALLEIAVFVPLPAELGFVGLQEKPHQLLGLERLEVFLYHEREQEDHQEAKQYAVEYGTTFLHLFLVILGCLPLFYFNDIFRIAYQVFFDGNA